MVLSGESAFNFRIAECLALRKELFVKCQRQSTPVSVSCRRRGRTRPQLHDVVTKSFALLFSRSTGIVAGACCNKDEWDEHALGQLAMMHANLF